MIHPYDEPLLSVLIDASYARHGILPFRAGRLEHDMGREHATMSPDEARASKRKFRKAWRKAAKVARRKAIEKPSMKSHTERYVIDQMGLGNAGPDRKHKRARKYAVAMMVRDEARAALIILTGQEPPLF